LEVVATAARFISQSTPDEPSAAALIAPNGGPTVVGRTSWGWCASLAVTHGPPVVSGDLDRDAPERTFADTRSRKVHLLVAFRTPSAM